MILFFEYTYGSGITSETIHVDLVNSDISCQEFDPGIFASPGQQITQAIAKVSIHGTAQFKAALAAIGRLQVQVQTNIGRNLGPQVYLYYGPEYPGRLYRAKVYSVDFAPEGGANFFVAHNRHLTAVLTIWHGVWQGELTQIPLSNLHETNNTSGLRVDNTTDVNQDHHMVIAKEDVIGDIPAPIRMEITNSEAAISIYQFWIGNNVNSYNSLFDDVLEGELATPPPAVSAQVYAAASNGAANRLSITLEADVDMITWNITATQASYMAGNQFHVLLRSIQNSLLPSIYWRFRIEKASSTYIYWKGEQVVFPNTGPLLNTADYGVIRMPPWRMDTGAASDEFDLILSAALTDGAAAATVDIDAAYLFAVDSFRNVKIPGILDPLRRIVDDMTEGDAWNDTGAGTTRRGDVIGLGSPILVHPGRDQQLSMIWSHTGGDTADVECSVKVYYRPLYLIV